MPGSDTRTSAQKATINWHPGWLGERDACGDLVGDWAQYLDKETFNCQWCNQERKYSSGGKSSLIQHSKSIKHKNIADRADAVFFIYAGTPGMVYHEQVILNIGWQKMKLAVDLSVWTIYCMKHIFVLKLTFFCQTWIFFLDLRTFLSNFVPTDVNALLLKSYPEDFRPILSWASSNPILGRNLSSTPVLAPGHCLLSISISNLQRAVSGWSLLI